MISKLLRAKPIPLGKWSLSFIVGIRFGPSRRSEGCFAMCCTSPSQKELGAPAESVKSQGFMAG